MWTPTIPIPDGAISLFEIRRHFGMTRRFREGERLHFRDGRRALLWGTYSDRMEWIIKPDTLLWRSLFWLWLAFRQTRAMMATMLLWPAIRVSYPRDGA